MKKLMMGLLILFLAVPANAQFPEISQGTLTANDVKFAAPINESKTGELTVASFNVRNLGARQRSLKNFANLVDLVDEADVVMIQEAGLNVYYGPTVSTDQMKRLSAVVAVLSVNLGDDWKVITAPSPTGVGSGTETTILAHRTNNAGYDISATWDQYVDLGDKRDMAVFKLSLSKNSESKEVYVSSVHLTPKDPDRGQQMIKVSDWLLAQDQKWAIVMGDFNWGYKKVSGIQNYLGEQRIRQLHEEEKLFQLFYEVSYLGGSDETKLRTNMGFRAGGYFYDQFVMTPVLAEKLADGGELLEDCGIFAFYIQSQYMKDAIIYWKEKRQYGLDKYLKNANIDPESDQQTYDKTMKDIVNQAANDATFILSDHRVIWMQLKVW